MQHIIYIPISVFCAVAALSWLVVSAIELHEHAQARARAISKLAVPTRNFRPIVINGGLQRQSAISYFRAPETSLRSAGGMAVANHGASRSYGG